VKAATARALAETEQILEKTFTLLLEAEEILQRAMEQDETCRPAAIALKALHDKEDISHDVTAEFVQRVI
jgi:16S rRNA G527 N7-methylase RsmG